MLLNAYLKYCFLKLFPSVSCYSMRVGESLQQKLAAVLASLYWEIKRFSPDLKFVVLDCDNLKFSYGVFKRNQSVSVKPPFHHFLLGCLTAYNIPFC